MKGAAYESMTPERLAGLILAAEKEARAVQSKLALMRRAQKRYLRALRDAEKPATMGRP